MSHRSLRERYAVTPAEVAEMSAAVDAEPVPQLELMEHHRRAARGAFPYGSAPLSFPDGGPAPAWSARLIANGGPDVPAYDSPAWHALDDNDPRRVAATVAAAEAWRVAQHPDVVADRLALELAAARHVAAAEAAEEAAVVARNVGEGVAARAGRPSYAELCELRGDLPERVAAAGLQAERISGGFEGLGAASRAVTRRRRDEAHRQPAAPLTHRCRGVGC